MADSLGNCESVWAMCGVIQRRSAHSIRADPPRPTPTETISVTLIVSMGVGLGGSALILWALLLDDAAHRPKHSRSFQASRPGTPRHSRPLLNSVSVDAVRFSACRSNVPVPGPCVYIATRTAEAFVCTGISRSSPGLSAPCCSGRGISGNQVDVGRISVTVTRSIHV